MYILCSPYRRRGLESVDYLGLAGSISTAEDVEMVRDNVSHGFLNYPYPREDSSSPGKTGGRVPAPDGHSIRLETLTIIMCDFSALKSSSIDTPMACAGG